MLEIANEVMKFKKWVDRAFSVQLEDQNGAYVEGKHS